PRPRPEGREPTTPCPRPPSSPSAARSGTPTATTASSPSASPTECGPSPADVAAGPDLRIERVFDTLGHGHHCDSSRTSGSRDRHPGGPHRGGHLPVAGAG